MAIHPVGIQNSFARHFVFWALFLPLLTIVFVPIFVPDQSIDVAEVQMVESFNVDVSKLTQMANGTFVGAFVSTGIMSKTEGFFQGKGAMQTTSQHATSSSSWIRGVWLMIYKLIWRIYALLRIFFIPLLALCIPAAIDGFTVRARKRYRFETSNPIFFYTSTHTVTFVFGLFVFLPLAPVTLSANMLAAMLAGLALAVWVAAANFQTGS